MQSSDCSATSDCILVCIASSVLILIEFIVHADNYYIIILLRSRKYLCGCITFGHISQLDNNANFNNHYDLGIIMYRDCM